MIFADKKKAPAATSPASAGGAIFDAGMADFEQNVLLASMDTPVLADFWAPWCGPCKQLTPVLEQTVMAAGGKVRLAKINIDENPELAQALRIQSVPTVYAFFQGRPVDAFTGARPAGEIKAFIEKLVRLAQQAAPQALNIPEALSQAAQMMAQGDLAGAQGVYVQILAQDEKNVQAYAGMVRTFIAAQDIEQARALADNAPDDIAKHPDFAAVRSALELAENAPDDSDVRALESAVAAKPADPAARFDLACALFSAGRQEEAMDHLIEIIRANRAWEEEKARKQILKFFEALGPSHPLTLSGRRKLSSVLFS